MTKRLRGVFAASVVASLTCCACSKDAVVEPPPDGGDVPPGQQATELDGGKGGETVGDAGASCPAVKVNGPEVSVCNASALGNDYLDLTPACADRSVDWNHTEFQLSDYRCAKIKAGQSFTFRTSSFRFHPIVGDGPIGTTAKESDTKLTVRFDTPGNYAYFCAIHDGMEGVIVVE